MRDTNRIILILTIVIAISCLLPWVHKGDTNYDGLQFSWGKWTFASAIFLIVVLAINGSRGMGAAREFMIAGAVAMALGVLLFFVEFDARFFGGWIEWRGKSLSLGFLAAAICSGFVLYYMFNSPATKMKRRR